MSVQNDIRRLTAPDIRARKGGDPIVCLTSYHAHTARIVDAYCDVILVGDSLGMVMHGLETTVPVTLDMMILQALAVMRGSQARARRRRYAVRLLRGIEGTGVRLRRAGDEGNRLRRHQGRRRPAHGGDHCVSGRARRAGDGPCRAHAAGDQHDRLVPRPGPRRERLGADRGRRPRGGGCRRLRGRARGHRRAARAPHHRHRSRSRPIGIGASVACDGQILVLEDMLGLSPRVPKFVKRFGELGPSIEQAVKSYAEEVRARRFPGPSTFIPMRKPKA